MTAALIAEAVRGALPIVLVVGDYYGLSPDESEQELTLVAWRALESGFDPAGSASLASYARRCAVNAIHDEGRRRLVAEKRTASLAVVVCDSQGRQVPLAEFVEAQQRSALEELIDRETWERAMARLSDRERRRAELVVAGFSLIEIALLETAGRL